MVEVSKIDGNGRQTLTAVSNADGVSIVQLWADPVTHRLLVDVPGAIGTVTSVSVVTANGLAGTVATPTTTPSITLSTSVTGIAKGNGTAFSAATDGTDYLSPTTGVLLSNVTTTSTASKIVQRDANANIFANNVFEGMTITVSAGGTTVLTAASAYEQILTGSSAQTYQLPDATTLPPGTSYIFNNNSSASLTITNASAGVLYTVAAGGGTTLICVSNSTVNGSWDVYPLIPGSVNWGSGVGGLVFNTALTTSPSISTGASSATAPSFIPQRGASTTGFGGNGTNLYAIIGGATSTTFSSTGVSASQLTSTVATGTAPLVVTSTTPVANLSIGGNAATVTTNANLTGDVTSVGNTATVVKINGTSLATLGTGILKNTTGTGVPSIAIAADFPTLNQNTTGSAATLTTSRTINGVAFNGSANITVPSDIAPSTAGNVLTSNGTVWTSAAPTGGGITWSAITADQTAAVSNGYLANKGTLLTLTLPATSAVGATVRIAGMNAGLFKVQCGASQKIHYGNQDTTTAGSISSILTYDALELVCSVANTEWVVASSVGNFTLA